MQKTIGIIGGKGIMGSFFADVFRKKNFEVLVSDKKTALSNRELVEKSDIAFFSVPIHETEKVIREILPYTRKNQLLLDFTSLKIMPMHWMLKSKAQVIGLHPMFRPSSIGLKNQTIVMCTGRAEQKNIQMVRKWFEEEDATIIEMSAKEHDHLMSIIQVLLHFHTIVLGHTLKKLKIPLAKTIAIASPIYRLELDMIGRIFSQDPLLYAAIEMLNPENKKVIKMLEKETKKLASMIQTKDFKKFTKAFHETSKFLGSFKDQALEEINSLLPKLKN